MNEHPATNSSNKNDLKYSSKITTKIRQLKKITQVFSCKPIFRFAVATWLKWTRYELQKFRAWPVQFLFLSASWRGTSYFSQPQGLVVKAWN